MRAGEIWIELDGVQRGVARLRHGVSRRAVVGSGGNISFAESDVEPGIVGILGDSLVEILNCFFPAFASAGSKSMNAKNIAVETFEIEFAIGRCSRGFFRR